MKMEMNGLPDLPCPARSVEPPSKFGVAARERGARMSRAIHYPQIDLDVGGKLSEFTKGAS